MNPSVPRTMQCLLGMTLVAWPATALGGGPRSVAGSTYFDPGVMGVPAHWASGQVLYFVDQGDLSATVPHAQAVALVDAAAAVWGAVPTAGVTLTDSGSLAEDVSGANTAGANNVFAQPADVAPTAESTPIGVIFDEDGSVIDTLFGAGTSDPSSCQLNGVMSWIDDFHTDATIHHAILLLNGRCTATPAQVEMMSYLVERAFGSVLGLGWSQVNPGALASGDPTQALGMAIMQPLGGDCGTAGGACLPNFTQLRFDDIAALNRLYPITASNLAQFPGKVLTAPNTVSINGTISFRTGTGMQGVNVVARPLDANGNPLYQYTVTFVSGSTFRGNHGSDVTGWTDANGTPLTQWGSTDPTQQGYFDLRFMPLPPGVSTANYQVTFETLNPLYIEQDEVGPYFQGTPTPSGTLNPISVSGMTAGSAQTLTVNVADSATGDYADAISTEGTPRLLPASGLWCGRLSQVGQTDWFTFPVRGNRTFTIVTEALDQQGLPTMSKAMPSIGIWDGFAAVGSASVGTAPGLNGYSTGETWLRVTTSGDDVVRMGIADMRGDGRPDYAYNGWVLSIDTVSPPRLPAAGGPIVIRGMGFHNVDTVLVNGQPAQVTSVSPNEISAIAPAAASGVTGSVDVEVDDAPLYYAQAIASGAISYDAGTGDSLTLVTAPANTVPEGVPLPFTVKALGSNLAPAGSVTVTYSVASGTATLACGQTTCAVTATGDGTATMNVTAVGATPSVVVATLANGASLQAHFSGGTPPTLAALNPSLSVAAGASVQWTTQALALNQGAPASGQSVAWSLGSGLSVSGSALAQTAASGIAAKALSVGPLAEGQVAAATACLNGTSQCVTFTALGARPEYATVQAVAGTSQSVAVSATPGQITLRVLDMNGSPMAGGIVTFYQAVYAWAPPCAPHGRCAQPTLLGRQIATATSALDGTVSFVPASIPGVATNVVGVASTGNSSALNVAIEQHP